MTTPATPGLGPDPADPGRPLVEAWLVQTDDGVPVGDGLYVNRAWAVVELDAHASGCGTVVPLIAADRLTDSLVPDLLGYPGVGSACGEWSSSEQAVRKILAALRAHLESE